MSLLGGHYLGDRVVFHRLPVAGAVLLYVEVDRQPLAVEASNEEEKGWEIPHFAATNLVPLKIE